MTGPRDFLALAADNIGTIALAVVAWIFVVGFILLILNSGRRRWRQADEP